MAIALRALSLAIWHAPGRLHYPRGGAGGPCWATRQGRGGRVVARPRRHPSQRPPITPSRSASTRAASSTTGPRAVLMRIASGFIRCMTDASTRCLVCSLSGTCRDRKSLLSTSDPPQGTCRTLPANSPNSSSVTGRSPGGRGENRTSMPNPRHVEQRRGRSCRNQRARGRRRRHPGPT